MKEHSVQAIVAGNFLNAALFSYFLYTGDKVGMFVVVVSWVLAYAQAFLESIRQSLFDSAVNLPWFLAWSTLFVGCVGSSLYAISRFAGFA